MRKSLMFASLTLVSGLALAQASPATKPSLPTTPNLPDQTAPATPPDINPQVSGGAAAGVDSRFGSLDVNADGSLSRTEANADTSLRKDFKTLDKNHDGTLSAQEYQVAMKAGSK